MRPRPNLPQPRHEVAFTVPKFVKMADMMLFNHRPMKKKGGTLAGIPRASGERNSPVGNGASHNQVSLIHSCIKPSDLCVTTTSNPHLLAMVFISPPKGSWIRSVKSLIPSICAPEKCKRPGGKSLHSAFAEQPNHSTPSSSLELATLPCLRCSMNLSTQMLTYASG